MKYNVTIQWTKTAKESLLHLPLKVRKGIFAKIEALRQSDPRQAGKPLVGPFQGYRRVVYSRYRAIFSVEEEKIAGGATLVQIKVIVVATGIRKERDKRDIYQVAKKLLELGLIPSLEPEQDEE
jgi:mRNA interferase RelE/StbE